MSYFMFSLLVRVVIRSPERGVPTTNLHQFVVRALLHQLRTLAFCILQDADTGRVADRTKPVCDDEGGPLVGVLFVEKVVHARLHQALRLVVQRRGGLVEEQDTCLLYTSPSPRDATLSRMPSSA